MALSPDSDFLRRTPALDPLFEFRADVVAGLTQRPRQLTPKYFYDARGSALFERICEQPEYYLTRTELAIMESALPDIAAAIGPRVRLVELGSGSGIKTELLLSSLIDPVAYVPVEISDAALMASLARLQPKFPRVEMMPCCADFTDSTLPLPLPDRGFRRTVVWFPGSTLGNFADRDAIRLLRHLGRLCSINGAVLLGLDLKKPVIEMESAYNDAAGVTAEFTLNLIDRINRELGGNFDRDRFHHRARYNAAAGRIETFLVSEVDQHVRVAGRSFGFRHGEEMLVEFSRKYDDVDIARLCMATGLRQSARWTDANERFAILMLEPV